MTPKKLPLKDISRAEGRERRRVAEKYLEVAELISSEDGVTINVAVGVAVLAGIAASDAICAAALGQRYSGQDHDAAADVLERVDEALAKQLRELVALNGASHYGAALLSTAQRTLALRRAGSLVAEARLRQP